MSESDKALRDQVQAGWPRDTTAPPFGEMWQRAGARYTASRRQYTGFAVAAAVVAMLVISFGNRAPVEEAAYIEIAELLETTYWSAPSDVLLPEREFDIYQELPVLFESTEPAEGALL